MELLEQHQLAPKKSLGQNFLVDRNFLDKIVAAAELDETKGALEIGPGIGALTQVLAQTAKKVAAVEIDGRLVPILQDMFRDRDNVRIVHGDALEVNFPSLFADWFADVPEVSVTANLPYYVTTPIIMKLLESQLPLAHIVVMVQKEVAGRMAALPGTKDYGSLSIAVQYFAETKVITNVPRTVFIPRPNVDSAIIRLTRRKTPPVRVLSEPFLFAVVQASFARRRKTIWNNLRQFADQLPHDELLTVLKSCNIDASRRGETLSLAEFAALSDALWNRLHK